MEPAFAASPQSVIGHTTQKRPRYSFENIHRVSTSPVASSPPQQARRRIGRRPLSALTQDSDGPGRYSGFSRSERGADQADVGHHMEEYEEKHRHRLIASLGGVDSGVMSVPQQARGLGRVLGRLGQELGLQGHGHDEGVDGEEGDLDRVLPLDWDSMRCTYKCRNMVKAEVLEGMDRQAAEIQELKQAVDSLRSANEAGESERQRLKRRAEALEQARAGGAAREESLIQNSGAEALKAEGLIRQQLTRCAELQVRLYARTLCSCACMLCWCARLSLSCHLMAHGKSAGLSPPSVRRCARIPCTLVVRFALPFMPPQAWSVEGRVRGWGCGVWGSLQGVAVAARQGPRVFKRAST
eukprot:jgi/Mesen1/3092/ME000184S02159